jgi:hypothetical protein
MMLRWWRSLRSGLAPLFGWTVLTLTGAAGEPGGPTQIFQVPGIPDVDRIAWDQVPRLPGRCVEIFHGQADASAYNNHANLAFFDGRFFAIWNVGYRDEDAAGQEVVYATSRDGLTWSSPQDVTGRPPSGRRYTDIGLWQCGEAWYALVSQRDAIDPKVPVTDDDCPLYAYRWDSARKIFTDRKVIMHNFFGNNVPKTTSGGDSLILGKGTGTENGILRAARAPRGVLAPWTITPLPPAPPRMEELEWYSLPDGALVANARSYLNTPAGGGRLIRLYSHDDGKSWSARLVTNFPEAGARNYGLRLSNGTYVLLLNPNSHASRIPLGLARSSDGYSFTRLAAVRWEDTAPRAPGRAKSNGYSYPRAIERDGALYVIYARNKEDVEITVVPLSAIARL